MHESLVPTQTNKNLATNAIKGLSIPSQPLARVRYDRDDNNKINIFGIKMQSKKVKAKQVNKVMEIDMIKIDPGS